MGFMILGIGNEGFGGILWKLRFGGWGGFERYV